MCSRLYDEASSKRSCGLCIIKDCGLTKCPYCGYENTREAWISRFFSRQEKKSGLLSIMKKGKATISSLDTSDKSKLRKLISLGIIPGKEIEVLQSFPAYIIKINNQKIVIDADLASSIHLF
jgi:Fe2+ transport system protein FeoA